MSPEPLNSSQAASPIPCPVTGKEIKHNKVPAPVFPAFYLTTDSVRTQTPQLMGRQSAGQGFLRSLAQAYAGETRPLNLVGGSAEREAVAGELRGAGWTGALRHHPLSQPSAWPASEVLYVPAPVSSRMAWQRSRLGAASLALCGVTHTICSSAVLAQIADYADGPFEQWDALVCTSQSVLVAVQRIWQAHLARMAERMGVAECRPRLPMTPVIPLGVHCADFKPDAGLRAEARSQWGLQADELVVLFVGRLSLHAKANPWPMYQACAQAAARSGRRVRVLECGWFSNTSMATAFDEAAALAGVLLLRVDGRTPGVTRQALAAADVFMSLSDNIQETFGLTPLEAMAAGLPVVLSDWDGYRETARHGVDGFLLPTWMPQNPAAAAGASEGYEDGRLNYDHYLAQMHLMASVDIGAAAQALCTLIEQPELRQRMGQAGRLRAQSVFDWSVVMPQYQALWAEQAQRRRAAWQQGFGQRRWRDPAFSNPLSLFAHYPSAALGPQHRLRQSLSASCVVAVRDLKMWGFAGSSLASGAELSVALAALPAHGLPGLALMDWAQGLAWAPAQAERLAVWLHKVGLIEVLAPEDGA